jgi:hypothetical protein
VEAKSQFDYSLSASSVKERVKNDIIRRQMSLSKINTSADKYQNSIKIVEKGGRLRSNLSKHNLFNDHRNLYQSVSSSTKDLNLKTSKPRS